MARSSLLQPQARKPSTPAVILPFIFVICFFPSTSSSLFAAESSHLIPSHMMETLPVLYTRAAAYVRPYQLIVGVSRCTHPRHAHQRTGEIKENKEKTATRHICYNQVLKRNHFQTRNARRVRAGASRFPSPRLCKAGRKDGSPAGAVVCCRGGGMNWLAWQTYHTCHALPSKW